MEINFAVKRIKVLVLEEARVVSSAALEQCREAAERLRATEEVRVREGLEAAGFAGQV